ncbi:MAG: methyltransferase, partial [Candidatus ainarchaeum sp.]|nr:methyltransferase [Candidatus ainarchaeum sp.]
SELLAKAIKISSGSAVLDMGCGTGIQGLNAVLQGAGFVCFADKNPLALENAKKNFELAKKYGLCKNAEADFLVTGLFSGINKKFDFVLLNPPYVPAKEKKFLDLDGGKKGREILDKFLASVQGFLNPKGKVFFLQSSLNGISLTKKILKEKGFKARVVARQKLFFEELVVFKAWQRH